MNGKKLIAYISVITLALFLAVFPFVPARAQLGAGILGLAAQATNLYASPAAGDQAGKVTNPSSNTIIDIAGGPVFCNGGESKISPSTMTLAVNTTYLVVFNCAANAVYAKTAVTAPGGQSSTTAPGTPGTFLVAIPGEVSLAKVVCGTTNCGDTSNGTITDTRSLANFPVGAAISTIAFADLPVAAQTGSLTMVSGATQPSAGSATCTSGSATVFAAWNGSAWRCF